MIAPPHRPGRDDRVAESIAALDRIRSSDPAAAEAMRVLRLVEHTLRCHVLAGRRGV